MPSLDRISFLIGSNEGFRGDVYRDTVGKRTVGIGFNVDDPAIARFIPSDVRLGQRSLTALEAQAIFKNRILPIATQDARSFMGEAAFNALDPVRQSVLIDMAYNLGGPRLGQFKKFRAALEAGNFSEAAAELLNSLYARQVPNRAKRNAEMILKGGR